MISTDVKGKLKKEGSQMLFDTQSFLALLPDISMPCKLIFLLVLVQVFEHM